MELLARLASTPGELSLAEPIEAATERANSAHEPRALRHEHKNYLICLQFNFQEKPCFSVHTDLFEIFVYHADEVVDDLWTLDRHSVKCLVDLFGIENVAFSVFRVGVDEADLGV